MPIEVSRSQTLDLDLEFFQAEEDGLRMNLTEAIFSVADSNFVLAPEIYATDLANGKVRLHLRSDDTKAMSSRRLNWFTLRAQVGTSVLVTPRIEFTAT